jgi:serine/threonine protein kinase
VHSDIKPANILFRAFDDPLLSDFGICQQVGEPAETGTPGYMSPERIEGADADPRDDIYAIGRIIEDVLGARDDAKLDDASLETTEDDARRWARIALSCMKDADARPADASAVLADLAARGSEDDNA